MSLGSPSSLPPWAVMAAVQMPLLPSPPLGVRGTALREQVVQGQTGPPHVHRVVGCSQTCSPSGGGDWATSPRHEPQTWPQRACPEGSLHFSGRRKARSRAELRVTPKPRPASESRPGQARSRPPPVFPSRAPLLAPSPARSLARTSPPLGLFSFSAVESEQHCIWQHGLHLDWNPGSNAF